MGVSPLGPFFFTEPAWVFGGLVGVFGFIAGSGIADDWLRLGEGRTDAGASRGSAGLGEVHWAFPSTTRSSASNTRSHPCSCWSSAARSP